MINLHTIQDLQKNALVPQDNRTDPADKNSLNSGLLVVGTHRGCGKTVATAGLTAAMQDNGLTFQAIKPLEFAPSNSVIQTRDQDYMNRVTKVPQIPDNMVLANAHRMTNMDWNRLLHIMRTMTFPCLIEAPGTAASPLYYRNDELKDATALAHELNIKMLLVTHCSPYMIDNISPMITYLRSRQADLIGWMAVQTRDQTYADEYQYWQQDVDSISREYQLPYLGVIGYSPSISVEQGHQGNLIAQVQQGVDLFPIQLAAGARIA